MDHISHMRNKQARLNLLWYQHIGLKLLISFIVIHCGHSFEWIWIVPYPRMLCAKYGWNWPIGSGEEESKIMSMYFHYFVIISPWWRELPFIWTNLNQCQSKILCAKFSWNWSCGPGEEDVKLLNVFRHMDDDRQAIRIHVARLSFLLRCP